jgi:glycosyltransferase involved in cell wall biosynthesis
MNILVLSTKMPWPPKDGGAIATLNLARGMAESGARVTILTMNTRKHYFPVENIPSYITDMLRIISVDVDSRIKPIRLLMNYLFSSYPYIAERFISENFRRQLESCLDENDFDLVQVEGPYLESYLDAIRNKSAIAFRAHNLEHSIWSLRANEENNILKKSYFRSLASRIRNLEMKLLKRVDLLVPISDSDSEGFRRMGHKLPVMVCPTGMDLGKYNPGNPDGFSEMDPAVRLFYIGALDWAPNQEGLDWFFKNVWPLILDKWPDQQLHIAGRNSSGYFSSTPPENVIVEGEIEDAIGFYLEHSIMIVPLLSGSGIRIKILEAMAMGRVVICSAIAASGLGVVDGEHLYIADRPEDYIRILGMLVRHSHIMRQTGHLARQFVTENFDNLVLSEKLISFYKENLA